MGDGLQFELALDSAVTLAEGPVWDERTSTLVWVDIPGGRVHRFDPKTGTDEAVDVGSPVGAAVLCESDALMLAIEAGFAELSADGTVSMFAPVEADRRDHRMNDGKVDPAGRLWAGTNSYAFVPGESTLWRLDPGGGTTAMRTGMTLCNGLGWSPDGSTMYVIDSFGYRIDAFPFDVAIGGLGKGRTLISFPQGPALPDGMTVDADGYIWVAMYAGGALHRYRPNGRLDAVVPVPVSQPTSCTFGGPDLDELYVTTARQELTDEQLAAQPGAGGIFRARPGARGLPTSRFAR